MEIVLYVKLVNIVLDIKILVKIVKLENIVLQQEQEVARVVLMENMHQQQEVQRVKHVQQHVMVIV